MDLDEGRTIEEAGSRLTEGAAERRKGDEALIVAAGRGGGADARLALG